MMLPEELPKELTDDLAADYAALEKAATLADLEEWRVRLLGKEGKLTLRVKDIAKVAPELRKSEGQKRNQEKLHFEQLIEQRKTALEHAALETRLEAERVDVTLPCRAENAGRIHPITQTTDEIIDIFAQWGFVLAEGPEIESDDNNFTKLNTPPDHPARQMQDTFYMPDAPDGSKRVLRTQTSAVQVRTMLAQKPPIRIITPGRVYRCDSDATHSPQFHQVEGLVIEETGKITMAHLKGVLLEFFRSFFGIADLPLRFRPSFFPFTEPSAEVDIGCSKKGGELKLGNFGDWMEVGGCGMVHPNVLEACGVDSTKYQGFAFGMGIDRMAMLKYAIPDIRSYFDGDIRWLKHYGFVPLDIPSLARGNG
jgi:phenylalanyl-tRNA synthetase alpha chain